ncbi:MAG: pyruvate ferredoxin oxidoreductase [Prevotella sp.]|nr:pyruvate ferredoxin oxidoreductase [Prevotella sp.]
MDYKYITQLLDRYWKCETTLEEEEILKAFFCQKDVPADFCKYKDLFAYEQVEHKSNVLGDDFDEKIMSMIQGPAPVKARVITMQQKLKPLFKAAAVVAIMLTLGNAAQVPFNDEANPVENTAGATHKGVSVALSDSAAIDTMQQSSINAVETPASSILK